MLVKKWLFSPFMIIASVMSMLLSDILNEKPDAYAQIDLLEIMSECNGGVIVKLSEQELKMLIKGGETNTVELKLAASRAVDLAARFCGMVNARGGIVIIGVEGATLKVIGVPDERVGETKIWRASSSPTTLCVR